MTNISQHQLFAVFLVLALFIIIIGLITNRARKKKRAAYILEKQLEKEKKARAKLEESQHSAKEAEKPVEWEHLAHDKIINLKSIATVKPADIIDVSTQELLKEVYSEGRIANILVVDDALVVRKKIGNLLQDNDYSYVLQRDGSFAIKYLTYLVDNHLDLPEIIITDLEMPNVDGIELISWIRESKACMSIPVIVVSSHMSLQKLFTARNIQGFINKPFKDEDLLNQIYYLLEN